MEGYSKEAVKKFLESQAQLFEETVARTVGETMVVLAEHMAVEVDTLEEVKEFLQENGMDIAGMSDEEIASSSEVFPLPSGRYLVIAG